MKQFIQKIGAFVMAFVVVLSTMSFTIDKHYCGTILVDVAINAKAKPCGMEMYLSTEDVLAGKKSCCKNEHIVVIGQDELKKNLDTSIEVQLSIEEREEYKIQETLFLEKPSFMALGNHDPPDIVINFQQVYETYII